MPARYSCAGPNDGDDKKERHGMGKISGDASRYNRQRRKKIARRAEMRALRATLEAKTAGAPQPKTGTAAKS